MSGFWKWYWNGLKRSEEVKIIRYVILFSIIMMISLYLLIIFIPSPIAFVIVLFSSILIGIPWFIYKIDKE